jgi:hypothetical protein
MAGPRLVSCIHQSSMCKRRQTRGPLRWKMALQLDAHVLQENRNVALPAMPK